MAQIFLHNRGHGHAQGGGKILHRHGFLFFRVGQQANQAASQILGVTGLIKLDGEVLAVSHLTKIAEIGADNRHPVGACQMGHAAASGGRRVGHDGEGRSLKEIGQPVFMHVACELDLVAGVLAPHRFHITCSLRMVTAGDNQFRIGQNVGHGAERLNHHLETLIGSPLAESENTVLGIPAAR